MGKIKVAFVASTFCIGGSEKVLSELLTRLCTERFYTKIFFLKDAGEVGRQLFRSGVDGSENLQKSRFDPFVIFRLLVRLKRFSPDILFALDHRNAMLWGRLASILAGVPVRIVASHSTRKYGGKKNFTILDKALMPATKVVLALSKSHAAYLREVEGIAEGKILAIENGIDIEVFEGVPAFAVEAKRKELGIKEGDKVVSIIACLRPEKGHEVFLKAARELLDRRFDLKFLLVGDGPRRGPLEQLKGRLGLGERALFLGERKDIPELLSITDVFVLSSHPVTETLPLAVMEAMASGVPVVATSVGSVPELVEDGATGRLVAPADPRGLAEAVAFLLDNPQEAKRMADRSRRLVREKYSVSKMVAEYEELFSRLSGRVRK